MRVNDSPGNPRDSSLPARPLRHQSPASAAAWPCRSCGVWPVRVGRPVRRTSPVLELDDPEREFDASSSESESDQGRVVLAMRPRDGLWFGAGADWERQEATTGSGFGPGLQNHHQRTAGLFGQAGWAVGRWRFDAGLRLDDNDFRGEPPIQAGAVGFARYGVRLRASYARLSRADSGDLYFRALESRPPARTQPSARSAWSSSAARASIAGAVLDRLRGPDSARFHHLHTVHTRRARAGRQLDLVRGGEVGAHLNSLSVPRISRRSACCAVRARARIWCSPEPVWAPERPRFIRAASRERSDFAGSSLSYPRSKWERLGWPLRECRCLETYGVWRTRSTAVLESSLPGVRAGSCLRDGCASKLFHVRLVDALALLSQLPDGLRGPSPSSETALHHAFGCGLAPASRKSWWLWGGDRWGAVSRDVAAVLAERPSSAPTSPSAERILTWAARCS